MRNVVLLCDPREPDNFAPEKVAAKLFALQAHVPASFFRPRLGPTQPIASRNVAFRPRAGPAQFLRMEFIGPDLDRWRE